MSGLRDHRLRQVNSKAWTIASVLVVLLLGVLVYEFGHHEPDPAPIIQSH
jgi:hypothetical protein